MSHRHPLSVPLLSLVALVGWMTVGCGTAQKPEPPAAKPAGQATDADHDHDHGAEHGDDHDHAEHADADHDHAEHGDHDELETLAEGVAKLGTLTREVAEKLASDAHEAADDAVHAAGHLIDDVRGMVERETITADAKEAATKALDELFECFDKLDVAFHAEAKEGAETVAEVHAAIAERVKEAVEVLEKQFPKEEK